MSAPRIPTYLAAALVVVTASASFAQPGPRPPLGEAGLRQKIERATGKALPPPAIRQVRQAQLDFIARDEDIEKKTREKIAEAVGATSADVPLPPRPGQDLPQDAYMQALERKVGKPLTPTQKASVVAALQDHRDDLRRSLDRYRRDLTAAVPHLTSEQATEILAPLGAQ